MTVWLHSLPSPNVSSSLLNWYLQFTSITGFSKAHFILCNTSPLPKDSLSEFHVVLFCSHSLVNTSLCDLLLWMIHFQKANLVTIYSSPYRVLCFSGKLLFCLFCFLSHCILSVFMRSFFTKPQVRKYTFKNEGQNNRSLLQVHLSGWIVFL